jgi:hypothetical protein
MGAVALRQGSLAIPDIRACRTNDVRVNEPRLI